MNFSIKEIEDKDFKIEGCEIYHYTNKDTFRINVFIFKANSNLIERYWKRFSNMVASLYQNEEYMKNSEFERWNFYIIYLSGDGVTKELKNKIENDKFSSRKIVEDSYSQKLTDKSAIDLIINHITHSDLIEKVAKTKGTGLSNYIPENPDLWRLIENEKIIGDREVQKEIIGKINLL